MSKKQPPKPTIEQKIKDLNYLLVNDRENPKVKELQREINYFFYGVKQLYKFFYIKNKIIIFVSLSSRSIKTL